MRKRLSVFCIQLVETIENTHAGFCQEYGENSLVRNIMAAAIKRAGTVLNPLLNTSI